MNNFFRKKMAKGLLSLTLLALMASLSLAKETPAAAESHQQIAKRFVAILNEQWGVDKEKITGETYFLRDFGADSMDIIELVMSLEDNFDIEILSEEWDRVTTVNSAVELIVDKTERGYYWRR